MTDVTTYADTNLTCDTAYYYRVQAYNAGGGSDYANVAGDKTFACPDGTPTTPSHLTATLTSQTAITLTWQDNSNDELGFRIERSPDGYSWTQTGVVTNLIGSLVYTDTSYVDTYLAYNTTYYYRVQAYNEVGSSGYSGIAQATTLPLAEFILLPLVAKIILYSTTGHFCAKRVSTRQKPIFLPRISTNLPLHIRDNS
ncbi:MAG: fibronectin type III domain-containing protein [Chloroflexi bacterium]|nr:fibronectin type III domain-containing protein [Chloroflexota bacterium]